MQFGNTDCRIHSQCPSTYFRQWIISLYPTRPYILLGCRWQIRFLLKLSFFDFIHSSSSSSMRIRNPDMGWTFPSFFNFLMAWSLFLFSFLSLLSLIQRYFSDSVSSFSHWLTSLHLLLLPCETSFFISSSWRVVVVIGIIEWSCCHQCCLWRMCRG